ncbi:expressed unknown protein [Seminavis robusta]|uniref:Uncharacterized protein n=1 Tax=Seminavis robusta TaxID=568900 RepID=A0A9N8E8F1_9STRA|nr:expressed unknown protein [Seminavis robusta]|eukprot:Sro769_g199740.1 n/a (465) ;mRNA; f:4129-5523
MVYECHECDGLLTNPTTQHRLDINLSTISISQLDDVLVQVSSQSHDGSTCSGTSTVQIFGEPSESSRNDTSTCNGVTSAANRQRQGRSRHKNRRRRWKHNQNDSLQAAVLERLIHHPILHTVERMSLCHIEESIPVQAVCLLLEHAPMIRELRLDDLLLEGSISRTSDSQPKRMERLSMTCCGPAEERLLKWFITDSHSNSSLRCLDLRQMIISKNTLEAISSLPCLESLHLEKIPGVYASNLVSTLSHVKGIHLYDHMPLEYATNCCNNLQPLELSINVELPLSSLEPIQFSQLLVSILHRSPRKLHLGFRGNYSESRIRQAMERPGRSDQWDHLASILAKELEHNQCLESLELMVSDIDMLEAMVSPAFQRPLEKMLTAQNTSLAYLNIRSPSRELALSPLVDFYLKLNKARRIGWFQDTLTPKQQVESLLQAPDLFPTSEEQQVSMIFHFLSSQPSSWVHG